MSDPTAHVEDADPWFCNLEDVAKRVQANEQRHRRYRRRVSVLALFMVGAFTFLAWRTQIAQDEADRNARRIALTAEESCLRGVIIVGRYNDQLDRLAAIERGPGGMPARAETYERGRILPLPACPPPLTERTPAP